MIMSWGKKLNNKLQALNVAIYLEQGKNLFTFCFVLMTFYTNKIITSWQDFGG
jgi:hypothetical protein